MTELEKLKEEFKQIVERIEELDHMDDYEATNMECEELLFQKKEIESKLSEFE